MDSIMNSKKLLFIGSQIFIWNTDLVQRDSSACKLGEPEPEGRNYRSPQVNLEHDISQGRPGPRGMMGNRMKAIHFYLGSVMAKEIIYYS